MIAITRSVLVTGAASGIGAAVCQSLAAQGIGLLLHTRANAEGAKRVADAARALGAEVVVELGDLAEPSVAGALVDAALRRFGRLDVVVSNAGFADRTPVASLTDAAFALSHDSIAGGFFRLARAASPHLTGGRLIAVSSFVAHTFRTDVPSFPASAAAKAALEALVRALAIELAPSGTTVNAVVPGFIRKDSSAHAALDPAAFARQIARIPMARLGEPADVAAAIGFLAAPEAGYITGQTLHVDGGLVI